MKGISVVLAAALLPATALAATTHATVGVGSNYIWRGETRTDDGPAVFGEVDSWLTSRFHVGGRTYNVEENGSREYAVDLFTGYRFPVAGAELEVGIITYQFPRGERIDPGTGLQVPDSENESDFTEAYAQVELSGLLFSYYRTNDYFGSGKDGEYTALDYQRVLPNDIVWGLHYGIKRSDAIPDHAGRVSDFGINVARQAFRLELTNLDDNEDGRQSDNARLAVYWRHQLSL